MYIRTYTYAVAFQQTLIRSRGRPCLWYAGETYRIIYCVHGRVNKEHLLLISINDVITFIMLIKTNSRENFVDRV